ncbi:MAG: adenylosuccinate lyase [Gammaproteobacteria bacterium]|nr:adenylosuccinate lyase [Gammaproteobacteria bacterium]
MQSLSALTAISPLDGRYGAKLTAWTTLGSEYALIKARVTVEVHWLIALANHPEIKEIPALSSDDEAFLHQLLTKFDQTHAQAVKDIERTTNHDVKAVEYFLKDYCKDRPALEAIKEFWHFACTSEDINNLSYSLMLSDMRAQLSSEISGILDTLRDMTEAYASEPMLSRTHGQTASPTTVGKEFANVLARLRIAHNNLQSVVLRGKINGAVGNFNAHVSAYPDVNWPEFAKRFVESLNLTYNPYTTQIEPHDCVAELMHAAIRGNVIMLDLARDIWGYISMGYFKQKVVAGEVGSSTMPHKVNPIDFENAEGNFGVANALMNHLAEKLPVSRWQRDLTDSTVLRNLGSAFAQSSLAISSLAKGLGKLELNSARTAEDLDNAWEVLAEPIQTIMRRYAIEGAYEQLKALTRGQGITEARLGEFVATLDVPAEAKAQMLAMTPSNYIGLAESLAREAAQCN